MIAAPREDLATMTARPSKGDPSAAKAWSRALQLTASIGATPHRILPAVLAEVAARRGDAPALLSDDHQFTFGELIGRARQYARWALDRGVPKGQTVGLLMPNGPEYMAIWLGITEVGGVVALLNTNLVGGALAHSIDIVAPTHLIVAASHAAALAAAQPFMTCAPVVWVHGDGESVGTSLGPAVDELSTESLDSSDRRAITIHDRALYIYTSGTTGLPKAAIVSHARVMQWTHWFAGLMNTQPADRMYNCLPMYHSVGGVLATGAVLIGGGSVVTCEKFSTSRFWRDVVRWDCTLVQYIGELCRFLLNSSADPDERRHRLRVACGNGMSGAIWTAFQERFAVPQILEFYASTEGNVSLFNVEGRPGAIGRVPRYLAHRFPAALLRLDPVTGDPIRNDAGFCERPITGEVGEAVGQILSDSAHVGGRFEGYTSRAASDEKVLHNVFQAGDGWVRTGDLMRCDAQGFFFFVDRLGDTFRWKGENVSASEVVAAIGTFPGVREAVVYGVTVAAADGRAGMATIVADNTIDIAAFRQHLQLSLPDYARPVFLRFRDSLDMTPTFKPSARLLAAEGYDPSVVTDPLFVDDRRQGRYVPVDSARHEEIQSGRFRV
jgi:fatty-acyl-CoA synthase